MPKSEKVKEMHQSSIPKIRRKLKIKFTRAKVLKMLAVMDRQQTPGESVTSNSQEFLTSGRTGRRNALPDILAEHAVVSSADLPAKFQSLTTSDGAGPSTSRPPSPNKQEIKPQSNGAS